MPQKLQRAWKYCSKCLDTNTAGASKVVTAWKYCCVMARYNTHPDQHKQELVAGIKMGCKSSLKVARSFYPFFSINPYPNKPLFLRVCSTSTLKTQWEKQELLETSNFSFSYSVFYPF